MGEWLNSLRMRMRAIARPARLEQDLSDEIAHHLAMRETQLRASGVPHPAADARQKFGSVARIQEELRDTWSFAPRLSAIGRDLRYAARTLRRSPGFSVVIVLTLALGIGVNTAFFSIVNAVLIRPLGFADADRLVAVHEAFPQSRIDRFPFSALDFDDLIRYQEVFADAAAYRNVPFELSGDGPPEQLQGAKVSANLFRTLGVGPAVGRSFAADEDKPGVHVAILSWGLWDRRYGGNPRVIGQTIHLDRTPHTIVGIMPATFVFPRRGPLENSEPADVWVPIAFRPRERLERATMHVNSVVARLKPGVSFDAAQPHLELLGRRIADNYPPVVRNAGFTPRVFAKPLREEISGRFTTPLLTLLAAGGLVLLIACANVANLILSRAATRSREFTVRMALGASRTQLTQLLLGESLLLSCAGGAAGIALAYWSVRAAPAVLARSIPGLQDVAIDTRVLAFTAISCVATSLIFALLPQVALDRRNLGDVLREDASRSTATRQTLRVQRTFVVSAVGLAFILLVGAGLFIRSFSALMTVDPGFRPNQVLTMSVTLPEAAYRAPTNVTTFHRTLISGLSSVPGIRHATVGSDFPLTALESRRFEPEASPVTDRVTPMTKLTWVHGPYFETFGMKVRDGRLFSADEHAEDRSVVIVNKKLAERFWPGQSAVGKRLKWGNAASEYPWLTVIGVVGDVADGPIGNEPEVHAYEPFRQIPPVFLSRMVKAAVRADGDPRAVAARIREEVARIDPQLAIENLVPMEQVVNDVFAPRRFSTQLVTVFAAAALLLAWIGLYGLLACTITDRRREIAVRLAVGARPKAVAGMVVAQGAQLVLIGLAAGLAGSLALTRLVTSLLYQTDHYDAATFMAVPLLVGGAALVACAVPAWRAARVEPLKALRSE